VQAAEWPSGGAAHQPSSDVDLDSSPGFSHLLLLVRVGLNSCLIEHASKCGDNRRCSHGLPVDRLFIIHAGWGPAGAAAALILASAITILASATYVISSGLQDRVWGTPSRTALSVRTHLHFERLTQMLCPQLKELTWFITM